jgi:hypothetical protein
MAPRLKLLMSFGCKQTQSYYPITGLNRPIGFQEVEATRFKDNQHMKVVRLSALHTGRLYPPGIIPGTHFCQRLSQPQGHSVAVRIRSMKNSSDTVGNQTRDLPVYSAVPQPTAPPRTTYKQKEHRYTCLSEAKASHSQ